MQWYSSFLNRRSHHRQKNNQSGTKLVHLIRFYAGNIVHRCMLHRISQPEYYQGNQHKDQTLDQTYPYLWHSKPKFSHGTRFEFSGFTESKIQSFFSGGDCRSYNKGVHISNSYGSKLMDMNQFDLVNQREDAWVNSNWSTDDSEPLVLTILVKISINRWRRLIITMSAWHSGIVCSHSLQIRGSNPPGYFFSQMAGKSRYFVPFSLLKQANQFHVASLAQSHVIAHLTLTNGKMHLEEIFDRGSNVISGGCG
ncbi:hypothetical protein VNO77_37659 [Canavalia gladiata]|uniref:Uncharacterized protein n=1 Tax=Canavalia gladiata TaxID=3824 RepID=A0AAN9PW71_CANGL